MPDSTDGDNTKEGSCKCKREKIKREKIVEDSKTKDKDARVVKQDTKVLFC